MPQPFQSLDMRFKAAGWLPDLPDLDNPGSPNARNVWPRTSRSFGPVASPALFSSSALAARCQGAAAYLDAAANVYQFAGDATALYQFLNNAWANVSKAGGYGIATTDQWRFEYANGLAIAADYADPLQSWSLGTSAAWGDLANGAVLTLAIGAGSSGFTNGLNYALTAIGGGGAGFTGLIDVVGNALTNARIVTAGSGYAAAPTIAIAAGAGAGSGTVTATVAAVAPKAKYLAWVRGFLMLANTNDGTFGPQIQRVWWSGANNPTQWPTPGTVSAATVLSSYDDLFGSGGANQGIAAALNNADAVIFQQHAIYRCLYAGPPAVFDFFPIANVKGCLAPGSIVSVNGVAYYLSEDGFCSCDGAQVTPIGADKIDRTFFADLDQNNISRVCVAVDVMRRLVLWAYPGAGNVNGNPNHIILFRIDTGMFTVLDVTVEIVARLLSVGYTLDQLYTVLGYTLDNLPAPLDSTLWTGGQVQLGLFDTSHRLNYLSGPALAATVDGPEVQPFAPQRTKYNNVAPYVDGGAPSVALGKRETLVVPTTFNPAVVLNALGVCPQRGTPRFSRYRFTMPAGASWTNMFGFRASAKPGGMR